MKTVLVSGRKHEEAIILVLAELAIYPRERGPEYIDRTIKHRMCHRERTKQKFREEKYA